MICYITRTDDAKNREGRDSAAAKPWVSVDVQDHIQKVIRVP